MSSFMEPLPDCENVSVTTTHSVPPGGHALISYFPIWCIIAMDAMLTFYIVYEISTLDFVAIMFPIYKKLSFLCVFGMLILLCSLF